MIYNYFPNPYGLQDHVIYYLYFEVQWPHNIDTSILNGNRLEEMMLNEIENKNNLCIFDQDMLNFVEGSFRDVFLSTVDVFVQILSCQV